MKRTEVKELAQELIARCLETDPARLKKILTEALRIVKAKASTE